MQQIWVIQCYILHTSPNPAFYLGNNKISYFPGWNPPRRKALSFPLAPRLPSMQAESPRWKQASRHCLSACLRWQKVLTVWGGTLRWWKAMSFSTAKASTTRSLARASSGLQAISRLQVHKRKWACTRLP